MAAPQEEQAPGAPEWMVTFSDIVTLLVTFFVLMLTFSSMEEEVFGMFADSIVGRGLEGVILSSASDDEALLDRERLVSANASDSGSDMPSVFDDPKMESKSEIVTNPRALRVFRVGQARVVSVPSRLVFLGHTTSLSPAGKKLLAMIAEFSRGAAQDMFVCEGPVGAQGAASEAVQLARARNAIEHLSRSGVADRGRLLLGTKVYDSGAPERAFQIAMTLHRKDG